MSTTSDFESPPFPKLPWNIYGYTCVASFTSFVYGYNTGLIAPAIIFIPDTIPLGIWETGAIVSIILLGALMGSFFSGLVADAIGRKRVIAWNNYLMVIAAITASLGDNSLWLLVSRLILGIGVGISSVVPSLYITEMAPPHIRGRLGAFNQLNGWLGIIVAYFVGYEVVMCTSGERCWRYMFASGALLCIFHFIITIVFLPDTPRWLIREGRSREALDVLTRIYGNAHEAHIIQQYQILSERKHHRESLCLDWQDWVANRKVLLISAILQFLQQASGNSPLLYYTSYIFKSYGYGRSESLLYNAFACIPQFLVLIMVVFLLDRHGRRPALIGSELGITTSLIVLGAASLFEDLNVAFWILLFGVIFHRIFFALGMGPVPTVLVSELLPFAIRGRGLAFCQSLNWTLNFIITITFPRFFATVSANYIYWFFAILSFLGFIFISLAIPETKSLSLETIETQYSPEAVSKTTTTMMSP